MALHRYRCALLVCMLLAGLFHIPARASAQGNLRAGFPNLDHQFKVIDRPNQDYNCIAYTLGLTNQWIDPQTGPANAPLSSMDQLYAKYGYHRTANLDLQANPGQQRVALYANVAPDGTIKQITHAALQGPDGTWTSKLGHLPLIRHASPFAVDGPTYGVPVATYVRDLGNAGASPAGTGGGGNFAAPPANQGGAANAANQGTFRNGLSNAQYGPRQSGANNGSPFQTGGRSLARNANGSMANLGVGAPMNGPLAGNSQAANFARASAGNGGSFASGAIRLNGGFGNAMNLEASAGAGNGGSFASSSIRLNGGTNFDGSFGRAFREAGRCCCGDDGNVRNGSFNNGEFAHPFSAQNPANQGGVKSGANDAGNLSNLGNAKNAGNSLNALVSPQGSCKNSNGQAQNVGNAKNAGNSLNALVSSGQAKNAGNGGNAGNTLNTGSNRIGSLPGGIQVNINGDHNKVEINIGTIKPGNSTPPSSANPKNGPTNNSLAKNTANAQGLAANVGNAKNAGATGGLISNVGNAKNAGISNGLASNAGNAKSAGNSLNTLARNGSAKNTSNLSQPQNTGGAINRLGANRQVGSLPGGILVNINGNHNTVDINVGAAKSGTRNTPLSHAKNGPTPPSNSLLAKNTGNPRGVAANVGNAKNAGNAINTLAVIGSVKNAGKTSATQNAKNGPGSLVGNKAAGNRAPLNAKNGPGSLVGNKTASQTLSSAKNAGPNPPANVKNGTPKQGLGNLVGSRASTPNRPAANAVAKTGAGNTKQGVGNLVGNKNAGNQAVAKNAPAQAKTGMAKQGAGNLVGAKTTVQNRTASPAIAKNAPNQQVAQRPASVKTGAAGTPNVGPAKTNSVANNAGAKHAPAIAKSLPAQQVQPMPQQNRGAVGNAATLARAMHGNQVAAAPGRRK